MIYCPSEGYPPELYNSTPPIGELYEEIERDPRTETSVVLTKYRTYELRETFTAVSAVLVSEEQGQPNVDVYKVMNTFLKPGPVQWAGPYQKREVLSFACGACHLVVVARDCGVFSPRTYSSGLNQYGQLGHGDRFERHELTPILALDTECATKVACGNYHSLALAMDGSNVFAWGRSDAGQLGLYEHHQHPGSFECLPKVVLFPEEIDGESRLVDIACGEATSFAVSGTGRAFSWGFNVQGATGQPSDGDSGINLPKHVELDENTLVEAVAGGGYHALFLVQRYSSGRERLSSMGHLQQE
jgi:alpha-tubulin suppressor-like RCC1 family protein